MQYVTQQQMIERVPAFPTDAHGAILVKYVNAWIGAHVRRDIPTPTPEEVIDAAAALAPEAVAGTLFKDTDRMTTSESVSAGDGVTTSESFRAGSRARTAAQNIALAMLAPWRRRNGGYVRVLRT